ncbi:ABC transporter permease [Terriglobus sp. TAA 43]|uniref:ABC transporter permease n=1 Tax=Terriglobus sp. TAA 43 TaxID=278961 RepID=UPI000646B93A|nr:ABC transporter permease [Terriglobus sp. TAA 43]
MMLGQNFQYAFRQLRRSPVFTATALLTLALGIGVTTAMYSVVRSLLLEPLPYAQPDRLVAIAFQFPNEKPSTSQVGSVADFLVEHAHSFSSFGIADGGTTAVNLAPSATGGGRPYQVQQLRVSRDFLPTLGLHPALGRFFTAEEDRSGGPRAALMSYRLWQTTFQGDPTIVGRTVRVNGDDVPVIGVLPEGVLGDLYGGTAQSAPAGLWQPLQLGSKDPGYDGDNYQMIARLRDGVTISQAQAEMQSLQQAFAQQHAWFYQWKAPNGTLNEFHVWPLQTALVGDVRGSLIVLMGAVAAVLLVACLNLAGLTVARSIARSRELAMRTALGASRSDLLRLMLSESILLAIGGALLGLMVARTAAIAFVAYAPISLPHFHASSNLWMMALVECALAACATICFGLLPALLVLRRGVNDSLRDAGSQGQSVGYGRTGRVLVVAQVALAFTLLSAASLTLHAFLSMRSIAPGFDTQQISIAQVTLKGEAYANAQHTVQFVQNVLQDLQQQPGVRQVGAVNGLPLDRGLNLSGAPADHKDQRRVVNARFVTPHYIQSLGIALLQGRDVTDADRSNTPHIAIASETAVKKWWPNQSALGQRITIGSAGEFEIVGVAQDTHERSLMDRPGVLFYIPLTQIDDKFMTMINGWFPTTFVIRQAGGVDLSAAVAHAIQQADPELPVAKFERMQTVVDETVAAPRFFSWMSSAFASFTLLLTSIGVFGLLSYQVVQRTREIGVRMALGASRSRVLTHVLWQGMGLTAIGLCIGMLASAYMPRLIDRILSDFIFTPDGSLHMPLLQQVNAAATALMLMLLIAAIASALPARRAASIDPMRALRSE